MKEQRKAYVKNLLIPCFLLSAFTGCFTGAFIFTFKYVTSKATSISFALYDFVRENPIYLPCLTIGAVLIGLLASLILSYAKECRGGGIPTAIVTMRGLAPFRWVQSTFALFASAILTYVSGVPLGTEGPSVQMGVAIGKGTTDTFAKKNKAWDRYIMTGGGCAGFAAATCAPLTGIIFALEEVHRRFSPTIFIAATVSVLSAMTTQNALGMLFKINTDLFSFTITKVLPMKHLWAAIVIGVICGICALWFTKIYKYIRSFGIKRLKSIPYPVKISIIFLTTALLGFISSDYIGSGHALTEGIFEGEFVWYLLIIAFVIRCLVMIFASTEGVSGGTFIPLLTFGAIVGGLIGKVMISAGLIEEEYFKILVTVGMATFLAVASRTPITAIAFAAEALCGVHNIIPVAIGVIVGYVIIEASGIQPFTDAIMEAKVELANEGKRAIIVNTFMQIKPDAFAIGKDIRDILWPPTCTVLSVDKHKTVYPTASHGLGIGDVLHLHYQTYDPELTLNELENILGKQDDDRTERTHDGSAMHIVPEG